MAFSTYIPDERLRPFVRSFAIQESEESQSYKVLPDTSLVLGFQYTGRLSYQDNASQVNGIMAPLSTTGITGLRDTYRIFQNTSRTGTVLVRFTETGAARFFDVPMHELFNGSYALEDIVSPSRIAGTQDRLAQARTHAQRIGVIESFLLDSLNDRAEDLLVGEAVNRIRDGKGLIRITGLAQQLFISQGRLEKRFRAVVGASPKKFASLIRLQQVIRSFPGIKDLTGLAYEAGYFDQAHFIHDFKAFTGVSPEQYLRSL